jgi:hypothetical protein
MLALANRDEDGAVKALSAAEAEYEARKAALKKE